MVCAIAECKLPMRGPDQLFAVFLFTILVTRVVLFLWPIASPTINGFRLHHWMYGVALVAIAVAISNPSIYAVGLGLFVDEVTFILVKGRSHKENFSFISLIGTAVFVSLAYLLRGEIFW